MAEKKSWVVTLECIITKEVVTSECTEQEARTTPFSFAIEEIEKGQKDYTVQSVEENI